MVVTTYIFAAEDALVMATIVVATISVLVALVLAVGGNISVGANGEEKVKKI